jgi:hypothetical protein
MRYLLILLLTIAPFCWSQQSTESANFASRHLRSWTKPILLNEVVVSTSNLSAYELVLAAKKVMESSATTKRSRTYLFSASLRAERGRFES